MGARHGRWRLARTGVFAVVCLALGAGAHAAAGATLPPAGLLALTAALLWGAGALLTARRLSTPVIAAALLGAQAAQHALFTLGSLAVGLGHAHGAPPPIAGMSSAPSALSLPDTALGTAPVAAHLARLPLTDSHLPHAMVAPAPPVLPIPGAAATALLAGLDTRMILAHLIATALCAVVLAHGEHLLWQALARVLHLPAAPLVPATGPLWRVHIGPAPRPAGRLPGAGRSVRGPPTRVA